jgi:hypothetical protein
MPEYKLVSLPAKKAGTQFSDTAEKATAELNAVYVRAGWEVVNAMPSPVIGQIAFMLKRG